MTSQTDFSQALQPFISNWPGFARFAALIFILIIVKILASARFKGWFGERSVSKGLAKLDPKTYRTFHDLYLPRPDGQGTTQLDHVVVSPFGVFVIETKNYKGWIFGDEKQRQWTQQIYRKKSRFQNPLHQNQLHVRALMDFLTLPESAFRSVIFFIGDATFKTPMPANVINKGLLPWIENHRNTIFDAGQVGQIRKARAEHELNTDRKAAARAHMAAIHARETSKPNSPCRQTARSKPNAKLKD
jgi:hypothetical protein